MTTDDTCRQVPAGDLTSPQLERKYAQPKLWSAIAAAEIEAMGGTTAQIFDVLLEHRLESLGGERASARYRRVRADMCPTAYEARAWLLGEIETIGELDEDGGGMPDEVASWVADVRAVYHADHERLVTERDELRRRVAQAGQQVLDLLAREARARAGLEDLTRRLEALVRSGGRCYDATNTEPDEVRP
jgi:hypothetical protein